MGEKDTSADIFITHDGCHDGMNKVLWDPSGGNSKSTGGVRGGLKEERAFELQAE